MDGINPHLAVIQTKSFRGLVGMAVVGRHPPPHLAANMVGRGLRAWDGAESAWKLLLGPCRRDSYPWQDCTWYPGGVRTMSMGKEGGNSFTILPQVDSSGIFYWEGFRSLIFHVFYVYFIIDSQWFSGQKFTDSAIEKQHQHVYRYMSHQLSHRSTGE
jgi:hypothetical protein